MPKSTSSAIKQDAAESVKALASATSIKELLSLILQTHEHNGYDDRVVEFVASYYQFCNSEELVDYLQEVSQQLPEKKREKLISHFVVMWVNLLSNEFLTSETLAPKLLAVVEQIQKSKLAQEVKDILIKKKSENDFWMLSIPCEPCEIKFFAFLNWNPQEIAENLTYIHCRMFSQVSWAEFKDGAWQKPNRNEKAPHLTAISTYFNQLSAWVSTAIVLSYHLDPTKVVSHFVRVCKELYKLRNYHILLALLAGLTHISVARLEGAWKLDKDIQKMYNSLSSKMSPSQNFVMYRAHLAHCRPPFLPCLPVLLSDLTFIHTGNRDLTDAGTINWDKVNLLGTQLQLIHNTQQNLHKYKLKPSPEKMHYLTSLETGSLGDEKLYTLSTEFQPLKLTKCKTMIDNLPSVDGEVVEPEKKRIRARSQIPTQPVSKTNSSPDLHRELAASLDGDIDIRITHSPPPLKRKSFMWK